MSQDITQAEDTAPAKLKPFDVRLDSPVPRREGDIDVVTILKPNAGSLRGVNLTDLLSGNVTTLIKVLPRITSPNLYEAEIEKMEPCDLLQMADKVALFLQPKAVREQASPSE